MSYCTLQQLIDRFSDQELIQLTDRENTGDIDGFVVDQAIADAAAEIDGYIAGRYTLPLSDPPPILERLCCDIARYYLYDDAVPDQVAKRYDAAITYLSSVAAGDILLYPETPASGAGDVQFSAEPSVFSRDTLSKF